MASPLETPLIGGDDFDDAFTAPPDFDDEGVAVAAFAPPAGKWSQPGGLGTPITLTYSYQNMFDGGLKGPTGIPLPATLIRKSIEEALGVWASVVPINYVEVEDDGLEYGQGSINYGQIRFKHIYMNGPDPPVGDPIAKAMAGYPGTSRTAGDVFFDHGDPWQEAGTTRVPDILGATIHELGHTLGLVHSADPSANMYWIFTRYPGLGTGKLHQDDLDAIRSNYGAGVGSVMPLLQIPEPASSTMVMIAMLAVIAWYRKRRR
jgi:hypothetical protein